MEDSDTISELEDNQPDDDAGSPSVSDEDASSMAKPPVSESLPDAPAPASTTGDVEMASESDDQTPVDGAMVSDGNNVESGNLGDNTGGDEGDDGLPPSISRANEASDNLDTHSLPGAGVPSSGSFRLRFEPHLIRLKEAWTSFSRFTVLMYERLPGARSSSVLIFWFILLIGTALVSITTRSIMSPFFGLSSGWLFLGMCVFLVGFFFSKLLSTSPQTVRALSITYAMTMVFLIALAVFPAHALFLNSSIMSTSGIFLMVYLPLFAGILCGDVAQSEALGDSFFKHHILPALQSNPTPISFLFTDVDGTMSFLDSKSIAVHWSTKFRRLEVNKQHPFSFCCPVFISHRSVRSAERHCLKLIGNMPPTRRNAMRHYVESIQKGARRFEQVYLNHILANHKPHLLGESKLGIQTQAITVSIDEQPYPLTWSLPSQDWKELYSEQRSLFSETFDSERLVPHRELESNRAEIATASRLIPGVEAEHALNFQRNTVGLLVVLRGVGLSSSSNIALINRRAIKAIVRWTNQIRSSPPPLPNKLVQFNTITLRQWDQLGRELEDAPISKFMNLYNWLNQLTEKYASTERNFAQWLEEEIKFGLSMVMNDLEGVDQVQSKPSMGAFTGMVNETQINRQSNVHAAVYIWALLGLMIESWEEIPC